MGGSAERSSVAHHCRHVSLGDDLALHCPDSVHLANCAPELRDLELEADLISRFDGPSELDIVERHEINDFAFRVPYGTHQKHSANLRHRFDDEDARNDWMPGEVSLNEWLGDRYILQPDDPLLLHYLENPVHEQERIAVGQNLHDVFDRIHPLLLSRGS